MVAQQHQPADRGSVAQYQRDEWRCAATNALASKPATLERLRDAVAPLGLTVIAAENLGITQSTVVRLRITNGQGVRDVIRALASVQLVAVAQPNYIYRLHQQGESAPASRGDTGPKGDAAQYILEKLKIPDVHRLVR